MTYDKLSRLSENIGRSEMKIFDKKSEGYINLNEMVKSLYKACKDAKSYTDLYVLMQNINTDLKTDWNDEAREILVELNDKAPSNYRIHPHNEDDYWAQFEVRDGNTSAYGLEKIKTYVSLEKPFLKDLYIGAIEYLVMNGCNSFSSKVGKIHRDDNICFWLSRKDYFTLESYLVNYSDRIKKGNIFVASRKDLGISHDLMDIDSYNGIQAKIIWDYFQKIDESDEIDVEEMYRQFIYGWNGLLDENDRFSRDFKGTTAQAFVVIMDTLDLLIDGKDIQDDSLLLSDDCDVWSALASSRSWDELKVNISRC